MTLAAGTGGRLVSTPGLGGWSPCGPFSTHHGPMALNSLHCLHSSLQHSSAWPCVPRSAGDGAVPNRGNEAGQLNGNGANQRIKARTNSFGSASGTCGCHLHNGGRARNAFGGDLLNDRQCCCTHRHASFHQHLTIKFKKSHQVQSPTPRTSECGTGRGVVTWYFFGTVHLHCPSVFPWSLTPRQTCRHKDTP